MPPRRRTFNFIGAGGELETLTIPMIGLVFMLSGTNCYIWGTKEKVFNSNAPIYHVPLPNIYADGKSNSHPEDIRIRLSQLQNKNRYPINDLVECGKSIEIAINRVINR